jgi:hypothetical protein
VRDDGSPVPRARVDVIPADLPASVRPDSVTSSPSGTTDADGGFKIDAILPGRYVVAVNARFGPRLDSPYPTTYYPGVSRGDARVVQLDEGERKAGFTIVVAPLTETTVSGFVVFDDHRPVVETHVTATPVDHPGLSLDSARAGGSGAFQLRLLAGLSYRLKAIARIENGLRQVETVIFVRERIDGLRLSIVR